MYIFEISIFGVQISPTWYGLMYAIGFIVCYLWMRRFSQISKEKIDSLLVYIFFGVILGGRIGYGVLYNFSYFIENPLSIIEIWKGGMSFHGGLIGVLCSIWIFSRKYKISFFSISDPLAIIIPIALGLGRIGNYINQELLGFSPYTGVFAIEKMGISYFPSTLLACFLEGGMLFLIMICSGLYFGFFQKETKMISYIPGTLSAIFLLGYGFLRIFGEIFRLPDSHIGYLFGTSWFTLGMLYTIPMIFFGGIIMMIIIRKKSHP